MVFQLTRFLRRENETIRFLMRLLEQLTSLLMNGGYEFSLDIFRRSIVYKLECARFKLLAACFVNVKLKHREF